MTAGPGPTGILAAQAAENAEAGSRVAVAVAVEAGTELFVFAKF
jgi:hypothetical protein